MGYKFRWKIFMANLSPVLDSEQAGRRPVLVITNELINMNIPLVCVIPFISYKNKRKIYPTELFLNKDTTSLNKDSILLFHQIRTISKERLENECGFIGDESVRQEIIRKIQFYFDIDEE